MHAPVSDPPTAAQVSMMIERLNNLSEDMRETRASLARIEPLAITMTQMQRDITHIDEKVRHLFTVSEMRGGELAGTDKRLTSLERWHKFMGAAVLSAAGMIGWGIQRIEYLYQMDTRIQLLELQVNGPRAVERAFEAPSTSGGK